MCGTCPPPLCPPSQSSPPLSFHKACNPSHIFMDITNNAGTSGGSWDLEMNMGDPPLLDQLPLELVPGPPMNPLHTQQLSSPRFHAVQVGSSSLQQDGGREDHGGGGGEGGEEEEEEEEKLGPMKEMMYRIASMQPVDIDPATIKKPKRRNVRISDHPQSTAARYRRERISERIRILQRLVPGGTKLDTASMLDEAIRYVKYLKRQVQLLQSNPNTPPAAGMVGGHLASAADWATLSAEALVPTATASSSFSSIGIAGGGDGGAALPPPPPELGFIFDESRHHMAWET